MKKIHKSLFYSILIILLSACMGKNSDLEEALELAGDNRPELERTLNHYKNDPLKLKAAEFLIENMPGHYSYREPAALNHYYDKIDSILKNEKKPDLDALKELLNNSPSPQLTPIEDVKCIRANYLIDNIDKAFDLWLNGEWATHLDFEDFCEYLLPYKTTEGQILDDWRNYLKNECSGELENLHYCDLYKNLPYKACEIVNLELKKKLIPTTPPDDVKKIAVKRLKTLIKMPYGICADYALISLSVMRAKGIPVGLDYTPQWPFRSLGHSWNVLLNNTGKNIVFAGAETVPGISAKEDHKMAKVFRQCYAINHEIKSLILSEKYVPPTFRSYFMKDVTEEYMVTKDVEIKIKEHHTCKYAYLAVYDNKNWVPVQWGKISGNKVRFKSMGKNVVYLPVIYGENGIIPISEPFLLTIRGKTKQLKANKSTLQTLTIRRKYPVFPRVYNVGIRVVGGKIQASNRADFRDSTTLFQLSNYGVQSEEIKLSHVKKAYQYWRYYSPEGKYCNMAELFFFRKDSARPIPGKIIGTSGSCLPDSLHNKEAVFDGDPLTYFDAPTHSGSWIGLDFGQPIQIERIVYIPYGDGNSIVMGNTYEVFYWDKTWISLGQKKADNATLIYKNAPSGSLFFIHSHSGGEEERIFTYENGKQVWW